VELVRVNLKEVIINLRLSVFPIIQVYAKWISKVTVAEIVSLEIRPRTTAYQDATLSLTCMAKSAEQFQTRRNSQRYFYLHSLSRAIPELFNDASRMQLICYCQNVVRIWYWRRNRHRPGDDASVLRMERRA
jgi:hypothetical protein